MSEVVEPVNEAILSLRRGGRAIVLLIYRGDW